MIRRGIVEFVKKLFMIDMLLFALLVWMALLLYRENEKTGYSLSNLKIWNFLNIL